MLADRMYRRNDGPPHKLLYAIALFPRFLRQPHNELQLDIRHVLDYRTNHSDTKPD